MKELQSIIDYGARAVDDPAVDPVFNTDCTGSCAVTECSCVIIGNYWSSTTWAEDEEGTAWRVGFGNGFVGIGVKSSGSYVRAVRDLASSPSGAFIDATTNGLD